METEQMRIERFWSLCGFKFQPRQREFVFGQNPGDKWDYTNHWVYSDGTKHSGTPPLDMNNLFWWAVPAVVRKARSHPDHSNGLILHFYDGRGGRNGRVKCDIACWSARATGEGTTVEEALQNACQQALTER